MWCPVCVVCCVCGVLSDIRLVDPRVVSSTYTTVVDERASVYVYIRK